MALVPAKLPSPSTTNAKAFSDFGTLCANPAPAASLTCRYRMGMRVSMTPFVPSDSPAITLTSTLPSSVRATGMRSDVVSW